MNPIEQVVEALRLARDETVNPEARARYEAALAEIQRWEARETIQASDDHPSTGIPAILLVRKEEPRG